MYLTHLLKYLLFIICLWCSTVLVAQNDYGFPLIQTYSPKQYDADIQNWAIAQRANGLIYIGNRHTLLEYDGAVWKKIELPNKYVVRSLCLAENDRLYIGGTDEFGYLGVDSLGASTFVSMKHLLPDDFPNFKDIWHINKIGSSVFFQTRKYVFVYDGAAIKVIQPTAGNIQNAFAVNNDYYVKCMNNASSPSLEGYGLYRYDKQRKELVYTGYTSKERFYGMLALPDGNILIIQGNDPFISFNPQSATTSPMPSLERAKQLMGAAAIPYSSLILPDGRLSIGTLKSGLFCIDLQTGAIRVFSKKSGLIGNTIYHQFIDQTGNLWLAQDKGLSYIRMGEPIRNYGAGQGIESTAISITSFKYDFYVGATTGVYKMGDQESFYPIPGKKDQTWQFFNNTSHLFAVQTRYFVSVQEQVKDLVTAEPWIVLPLKDKPNLWLVGNYNDGLSILESTGKRLKLRNKVAGFRENSRKMTIDYEGNVWVSDKVLGIWKLRLNNQLDSVTSVRFFGKEEGLPSKKNNYLYPYKLDGKALPLFGTSKGFYLFDYAGDSLKPFTQLNKVFQNPGVIRNAFAVDEAGNMCFLHQKDFVLVRKLADGSYQADSTTLAPIKYKSADEIQALGNGIFSITSDEGVFFANINKSYPKTIRYSTKIRKVFVQDSLIYGGEGSISNQGAIPFEQNTLKFHFAASFFSEPEKLQFQYKLEGFDKSWSEWTTGTFKEYTNIPEGNYTFLAKAKNLYNQESEIATYQFEVLPPWYRTTWAYIGYVLGILTFTWLGIRINTYRLKKENERLEYIILQRTSEIQEQKEEIQIQAEEIRSQNEVLTVQKNELEKSYENLRLLNNIGKDITHNLSLVDVVETVYQKLSNLLDTTEFGIGIYDKSNEQLIFKNYFYKDQVLPQVLLSTKQENRLAVKCLVNNQEIWLNNIPKNYNKYIDTLSAYKDGELLSSVVCLPLVSGSKKIGVLSVQSDRPNAYSEYQVNLLRNITTYTAVAIENARSYEKILELDQFKESMTGMIVHDLKNPLNSVIGLSKGEPSKHKVQMIHQSGQLMLNLVSNILDVYKFESTQFALKLGDYNLYDLVATSLKQVAFVLAEKSLQFINQAERNLTVHVDTEITARIFVNLLTNAIKYTPAGGSITLEANRSANHQLTLTLTDTGEGIPKEKIDLIFDKFGQAEARKSGLARSTGLGLTFCKMAVEAHGGKIWVNAKVDRGASFSFTLPIAKQSISSQTSLEVNQQSPQLALTDQERAFLQPHIATLRELKIYQASKLNKVLKTLELPSPSNGVATWKSALRSASMQGNQIAFDELLDLIN